MRNHIAPNTSPTRPPPTCAVFHATSGCREESWAWRPRTGPPRPPPDRDRTLAVTTNSALATHPGVSWVHPPREGARRSVVRITASPREGHELDPAPRYGILRPMKMRMTAPLTALGASVFLVSPSVAQASTTGRGHCWNAATGPRSPPTQALGWRRRPIPTGPSRHPWPVRHRHRPRHRPRHQPPWEPPPVPPEKPSCSRSKASPSA